MKEFWKHFLSEITSDRWIVTVLMTTTFCFITVKCIYLFAANLETTKFAIIEKISMFIFGVFTAQAGNVITSILKDHKSKKEETK